MSKRTEPRNKIDRRLGCNLWGEPKSPLIEENMVLDNMVQKEKNFQTMEFNFLLNKN